MAHDWIEVSMFRREAPRGRYPAFIPEWEQFEVLPDFMAELLPVIVSKGFAMMNNPLSSLLVVGGIPVRVDHDYCKACALECAGGTFVLITRYGLLSVTLVLV